MKRYKSIDKSKTKQNLKKEIIVRMPSRIYDKYFPEKSRYYDWLRLYWKVVTKKRNNSNSTKTVLVQQEIPQFNFWVFSKVYGIIGFCDYHGYEYSVEITAQEEGFNIIKSFFEMEDNKSAKYDVQYNLSDEEIWNLDYFKIYDSFERKLMCKIYQKYFRLSDKFSAYVKKDLEIINGKKVLGVLMRGTDYTRKKPHGHPVQPDKEEILKDIEKIIEIKKYKYLYLATDEFENEEYLKNNLKGRCEILVNRREYYDEFYKEETPYISSCRHDRHQDRFLTSMEYLSSIIILSQCNELLAGNCGGSRAAIYINNGKYEDIYLYDKGNYV